MILVAARRNRKAFSATAGISAAQGDILAVYKLVRQLADRYIVSLSLAPGSTSLLMDFQNALSLGILQAFCGDLEGTNIEALEAIWYAYWAEAYRSEKRFNPERVFASPQYPLTKYQLSNGGYLLNKKRVPDFLLLFADGHRDNSRTTAKRGEVTDYTKMLSYYMGNCVVDGHAVLAVCEIKSAPKIHVKGSETFQRAFERIMAKSEQAAQSGAHRQLGLYFSAIADEGKHVAGVAAIAAVGPFFAIANCEEDQADALSNNTDSSFRSSDVSIPSSVRRAGVSNLYEAQPLDSPEPRQL